VESGRREKGPGEFNRLLPRPGVRHPGGRVEDDPGGGRRSGVSEVIRISFGNSEEDFARLKLAVLDIVMLDGKDLRAQQAEFAKTLEASRQADAAARPAGPGAVATP